MKFVDTSNVRVRMQEQVVARDGTALSVDLYLPPGGGRHPVLLTRTPYDNNRAARPRTDGQTSSEAPARRWQRLAAHGYVIAAADVRGRGDSEGTFKPFELEGADGADTVAWVRDLDECDGRVGVFGSGYAGWCALAAAAASHRVDVLHLTSPFGDPHGMPFERGVLRLDWLFWMHLVGGRTLQPVALPPWEKIWRSRPLRELDTALGREDIWWRAWLESPLAAPQELGKHVADLAVPIQLITGWWDQGLPAARVWWDALNPAPMDVRRELVVGPWDTRGVRHPRSDAGGLPWGPSAVVDPDEELLRWFDGQFRADPPTGVSVRTFTTGLNEWGADDLWPSSASPWHLWLESDGSANTRRGSGRLAEIPPVAPQRSDAFMHVPANPVPWHPHTERFDAHPSPGLSLDNSHITSRDDALVYRTAPSKSSSRLIGRAELLLYAETDNDDADWIALLADVFPAGARTVQLARAAVRAAATPGFAPNTAVKYVLTFDDIDHVLLPGHSLQLTIVSSLFPLFAVNPGDADYLGASTSRCGSHQVLHDAEHPSALTLQAVTAAAPTSQAMSADDLSVGLPTGEQ